MTTFRTVYDAAVPPARPPATDGVMVYAGGAADHVWTEQEISAQGARGLVPVWCYAPGRNGSDDGSEFANWLMEHKVPVNCTILIDWETHVDRVYSADMYTHLMAWDVVSYGSLSTLFMNETMGGWWPADWSGQPHLFNHPYVLGTQYAAAQRGQTSGPWDLSLIAPQVTMWNTDDPHPLIHWLAPGNVSLAQLAAAHHTEASTILRQTLASEPDGKFPPELAAYINAHNLTAPVPPGVALVFRNYS